MVSAHPRPAGQGVTANSRPAMSTLVMRLMRQASQLLRKLETLAALNSARWTTINGIGCAMRGRCQVRGSGGGAREQAGEGSRSLSVGALPPSVDHAHFWMVGRELVRRGESHQGSCRARHQNHGGPTDLGGSCAVACGVEMRPQRSEVDPRADSCRADRRGRARIGARLHSYAAAGSTTHSRFHRSAFWRTDASARVMPSHPP